MGSVRVVLGRCWLLCGRGLVCRFLLVVFVIVMVSCVVFGCWWLGWCRGLLF